MVGVATGPCFAPRFRQPMFTNLFSKCRGWRMPRRPSHQIGRRRPLNTSSRPVFTALEPRVLLAGQEPPVSLPLAFDGAMVQPIGPGAVVAVAPANASRGLTGKYFPGRTLANPSVIRVDPGVRFNWDQSPPDPALDREAFTVRWIGRVKPLLSETYTFHTRSTGGIRLWVDGRLLIDNAADHPMTEDTGTIPLEAGNKYDIVLEYYHSGGGSRAKLLWSSPSQPRQVIPESQLYPRWLKANTNHSPVAPTITEPGLNQTISAFDVHMETAPFDDPDPGDTHLATDWQIWTAGSNAQRVWSADRATETTLNHHIHLGDGRFVNSLAGMTRLAYDTHYILRARYRDDAGDSSGWSTRAFRTAPAPQVTPGAPDWTVEQPGFVVEQVATGFQLPVNIAFVPNPGPNPDDPLFYVTELYGTIRVITRDFTMRTYAGDLLNFNPTGDFPGSGEMGVAGLVVEPSTGDLFASLVYDVLPDGSDVQYARIIRLHSTDGGLSASSQSTILDMFPEEQGPSHQISNLTLGPDGKLYAHAGDGFIAETALDLDSFRGKVLRLNLDGSAPSDNPFYNAADGITARDYIFAYGLRNPFGGAWRASDGQHYSVENGPNVDRFARITRGTSYGYDGSNSSMHTNALYNWEPAVAPVNIAFIQSSTFGGSGFPSALLDHAFISLSGPTYASGPNDGKRIVEFQLDAAGNVVAGPQTLVSYSGAGHSTVVALAAGPDGLYFSTLYPDDPSAGPIGTGAQILRVRYTG